MDVFAYVCADQRILLLYEVFHGQVVQAFSALNNDCDDDGEDPRSIPRKNL